LNTTQIGTHGERSGRQGRSLTECEKGFSDSLSWLQPLKTLKHEDWSFADFMSEASEPEKNRAWLTDYGEGFNATDSQLIGAASRGKKQTAEDAIDGD